MIKKIAVTRQITDTDHELISDRIVTKLNNIDLDCEAKCLIQSLVNLYQNMTHKYQQQTPVPAPKQQQTPADIDLRDFAK